MAVSLTKIPIKVFEESWKDSVMICIRPEFFKNQMKFPVAIQVGEAVFMRNGFKCSNKALYFFYLCGIEKFLLEIHDIYKDLPVIPIILGGKLFRSVSGKNFKVHWILKANGLFHLHSR